MPQAISDCMDIPKERLCHCAVYIPFGTESDDLLLKADVSCYGTFNIKVNKDFSVISYWICNTFYRS